MGASALFIAESIETMSVPVLIVFGAVIGALSVGATGAALYWKLQTGFHECKMLIGSVASARAEDAERIDGLEEAVYGPRSAMRPRWSSGNAKRNHRTSRRSGRARDRRV